MTDQFLAELRDEVAAAARRADLASDPLTGLPLQFRYWYDANNKKEMLSVEALYGVAVGNGTAAVRTARVEASPTSTPKAMSIPINSGRMWCLAT